jgi:hypothetical protein
MRVIHIGLLGVIGSVVLACGGVSSPASKCQEAAQNITENERFGRVELVLQRVAPAAKAEFIKAHTQWGGRITIADTELGNFQMPGKEDATFDLRVTWYDSADQELRSTLLRQKWHSTKGEWLLTSEDRVDGDVGLVGEKVLVQAPDEAPVHAQFKTVRIGAVD